MSLTLYLRVPANICFPMKMIGLVWRGFQLVRVFLMVVEAEERGFKMLGDRVKRG